MQLEAKIQELQHKIAVTKDSQTKLDHLHRQIMQQDYDMRLEKALELVRSLKSELATEKMVSLF
jgi:hypothetical protein